MILQKAQVTYPFYSCETDPLPSPKGKGILDIARYSECHERRTSFTSLQVKDYFFAARSCFLEWLTSSLYGVICWCCAIPEVANLCWTRLPFKNVVSTSSLSLFYKTPRLFLHRCKVKTFDFFETKNYATLWGLVKLKEVSGWIQTFIYSRVS